MVGWVFRQYSGLGRGDDKEICQVSEDLGQAKLVFSWNALDARPVVYWEVQVTALR
jgi:hypothetical protein